MQAQNSLTHRGAVTMVVGAAIFLIYAIVFFFRAFSSTGFELGVATLNGVTQAQLNQLNPAIVGYITHLHLATMVWSARRRMVGVDNRSDFPGRGFGGCPPDALHGSFRARLGKPSWAYIRGNLDICGWGRDGVDRLYAQGDRDRLSVAPTASGAASGGASAAHPGRRKNHQ